MKCPACGRNSCVIETRKLSQGLRRRRNCLHKECGAKFSTVELIVPDRHHHDKDLKMVIVDQARARVLRAAMLDVEELLK